MNTILEFFTNEFESDEEEKFENANLKWERFSKITIQ